MSVLMYAAVLLLTVGVASSPAAADSGWVPEMLDNLMTDVVEQGPEAELDGEPVFAGRDRFLPGKIALGFGWLLWAEDKPNAEAFDARLAQYRTLLEWTQDEPNRSWGIYYSLSVCVRRSQGSWLTVPGPGFSDRPA